MLCTVHLYTSLSESLFTSRLLSLSPLIFFPFPPSLLSHLPNYLPPLLPPSALTKYPVIPEPFGRYSRVQYSRAQHSTAQHPRKTSLRGGIDSIRFDSIEYIPRLFAESGWRFRMSTRLCGLSGCLGVGGVCTVLYYMDALGALDVESWGLGI